MTANAVNDDLERSARRLIFNATTWWVRAGWSPVLFGVDGLRLSEWIASGAAAVVRDRGGRTVYRVQTDASADRSQPSGKTRRFFVKHHRCRGPLDVLKNLIRGSAARREWKNAQAALRRGVATAVPVAWGEKRLAGIPRESFLVTQEIADAVPLDRYETEMAKHLPPEKLAARRREAIEALAGFVAAVHEAGLDHGDFHAGNILVQTAAGDSHFGDETVPTQQAGTTRPRFFLIDLVAVRFGKTLAWPASRKNLVVLNAEWRDRCTPRERWRFWRSYIRRRPSLSSSVPESGELTMDMDLASRAYSRRVDRGRDRRALGTNRDFYAIKRHVVRTDQDDTTWRAHAVVDLPQAALQRILACPDDVLLDNLHRPIKLGHSSAMVRARVELAGRAAEVCYKRYRAKNRWKAFLQRFRTSRAMRSWRLGHAFLARGIDTPRPLMVCRPQKFHGRRAWHDRSAYLATEWIEEAENLHLWAWALKRRPLEERIRSAAACAESLGRLLGRMHARGVSHGDLKGSNVLITDACNGTEGTLRTFLIDLDAARVHRRLPRRRQVADLARLATSLAAHAWVDGRLWRRFWVFYAREFPRGAVQSKALWHAVARRSKKLLGKKKKRGEAVL